MATCHKIGKVGQGRQNQEYGRDLSSLVADQGVPDCGLVFAEIEGRGDEGVSLKPDFYHSFVWSRIENRLRGDSVYQCLFCSRHADPLAPIFKIKPVQKQTRAGQRTRFKAIVVIGDSEGHVGLGIKTSKEVATAIRAAIIIAKLSVLPVRRGYWGSNLGEPHSLPTKESGKCGSVTVRVCDSELFSYFRKFI